MRKLSICLVILLSATAAVAKDKEYKEHKQHKQKEKRFEAVVRPAAEYAGVYKWSGNEYGLELEWVDGRLRGRYIEKGIVATIDRVELDGADFTATARYPNGGTRTVRGSFANRILNGVTAFGVRVRDVRVEGMDVVVNTFFERVN